jgi:hypothetical protein
MYYYCTVVDFSSVTKEMRGLSRFGSVHVDLTINLNMYVLRCFSGTVTGRRNCDFVIRNCKDEKSFSRCARV